MSKREQGRAVEPLSPKHASHRRREERLRRWLHIGTYAALAAAVILVAVGLVDKYILAPRTPVAKVGQTTIALDEYQTLYRFRYWTLEQIIASLEAQKAQLAAAEGLEDLIAQFDQEIMWRQYQMSGLATSVLDELIDQELARQEAQRRGITVSAEEVQQEIERRFGFERNGEPSATAVPTVAEATPAAISDPAATPTGDSGEAAATLAATATPTPWPTEEPMTEDEFQAAFQQYMSVVRSETGLAEEGYRRLVEAELLLDKVSEAIREDVPTVAEQVQVKHILLEDEEQAEIALARLRAGEDFAAVAAELSTDTLTKEQGGDLGWLPRGVRSAEFDAVAFALEPGQLSEIIQTELGYEIIMVTAHEDSRELDPEDLQTLQNQAVEDWFAQRRSSSDVVRLWDSTMVPSLNP